MISIYTLKFQSLIKFISILLQTHSEEKKEYLLAVLRPKVMEKQLSSVCRSTNYYILMQKPQAHAPVFVFEIGL